MNSMVPTQSEAQMVYLEAGPHEVEQFLMERFYVRILGAPVSGLRIRYRRILPKIDRLYIYQNMQKDKLQVEILDNFIKEQGITRFLFNGAYFQDFHGRDPEMDGKALNDYLMGKKVVFQERAVTIFQCKP